MNITLPPWSYSSINCFETCPKQYYHKYILKQKEPISVHAKNGTNTHTALEHRLRDKKPLDVAYSPYEKLVGSVEKAATGGELLVEVPLAITKEFTPCGFFDRNVWGRGKADIVIKKLPRMWVGDWKTGKIREKKFQVQVFAGFLFKMYPEAEEIHANNLWLNDGKVGESYRFTKEGESSIWQEILYKLGRIELAASKDKFDPKPSGLCKMCFVKDCPFNKNEEV